MQIFGGVWTEQKLRVLKRYMSAYATALKNQPFQRVYIDAFAGSGDRFSHDQQSAPDTLPFTEMRSQPVVLKGSARVALEVEPPFSRYIFVEKNKRLVRQLRQVGIDYPQLSARMEFRQEDANVALVDVCRRTDWKSTRALVFLDPYGMQCDWETVRAIARTEAADVLYLVPTGTGISRVIPHSGAPAPAWQRRLVAMTGDPDWRESLYKKSKQAGLFESAAADERNADINRIEAYFLERLRTEFPGVSDRAVRLGPTGAAPLYLLTFACSSRNKKARELALRIWNSAVK